MADGDRPRRPRPPEPEDEGIPLADEPPAPRARSGGVIPPEQAGSASAARPSMPAGKAPHVPAPPPGPMPKPGQPLPRLWKDEVPAEEPTERRSRRDRDREDREPAKPSKPAASSSRRSTPAPERSTRKGALIEETPEFDTYDARSRVRMLVGGVIGVAILGLIFYIFQSMQGPSFDETGLVNEAPMPVDGSAVVTAKPAPNKLEGEAADLLGTARSLAKNGKTKESQDVLARVLKSYPKTKAGEFAKTALGRPAQGLPLFLEEDLVVASKGASAPTGEPVPGVVAVDASVTSTGKMAGNATLQLQPNASEAPRAPAGVTTKAAVAERPLPAGFRREEDSGLHQTGWPYQIVSDRDGGVLVFVPSGTFTQGRDDGDPNEGPAHQVRLSAYYIDQHEVTNKQYEIYLKETGRRRATPRAATKATANRADDEPATNVTGLEAKAYLEWAGKLLPTEAQWEAAARSADRRPFPWGSSDPIWSKPRASRQIDPVGSYELDQSPCGALDMAGNAWEWTRDWYDSKYYQTLKTQAVNDPIGAPASRATPPQLVVKGGSKKWLSSWREGYKVESRLPYIGFRGVLMIDAPEPPPNAVAAPTQAPSVVPEPTTRPTRTPPAAAPSKTAPRRPGNNEIVPF